MPSCNVKLKYQCSNTNSIKDFKYGSVSPQVETKVGQWWRHVELLNSNCWQKLMDITENKTDVKVEEIQVNDDRIEVSFLTGSLGFDLADCLVQLLNQAGFICIEAFVYSDECDYVADDEGKEHPIGLRYSVDDEGDVVEDEYPEIELEYYD